MAIRVTFLKEVNGNLSGLGSIINANAGVGSASLAEFVLLRNECEGFAIDAENSANSIIGSVDAAASHAANAQGSANTAQSAEAAALNIQLNIIDLKTNIELISDDVDSKALAAASSASTAASQASAATTAAALANTYALVADNSATSAANSSTSATISATQAESAKTAANQSAQSASADLVAVHLAKDSVESLAADIALDANNSNASAVQAANSALIAAGAKDAAQVSASAADTSKLAAGVYAQEASSSAASALSSKNSSASSATQANTKAQEAAASAASALAHKNSSASNAQQTNSDLLAIQAIETNISQDVTLVSNYATQASNSASAAQTAANSAQTAANASSSSASASDTAKVASEAAKNAAVSAKTGAETARVGAESARDEAVSIVSSLTGSVKDMGGWDASQGTLPTPPTHSSGSGTVNLSAFWKVTVAGTVAGVSYAIGNTLQYSADLDEFYKLGNAAGVSSVNGKSGIVTLSASDVGAIVKQGSVAVNRVAIFADSTGNIKDSGFTIGKSVPSSAVFTDTIYSHPIGDGFSHVPATSTSSNGYVLRAGSTANSTYWAPLDKVVIGLGNVNNWGASDATDNPSSTTYATSAAVKAVMDSIGGGGGGPSYWPAAMTLSVIGGATGSVSFDGSANSTLSLVVADNSHTHTIANITNLQGVLDSKYSSSNNNIGALSTNYAAGNHNHASTYLGISANAVSSSRWATSRVISLSGGATGSVSLDGSANVTLPVTILNNGHYHTIENVTGLQTALDTKYSPSNKPSALDIGALPLTGGSLSGVLTINVANGYRNVVTTGWSYLALKSGATEAHIAHSDVATEGAAEHSLHLRPSGSNFGSLMLQPNNSMRHQTSYGYITIGSLNTSHAHFDTDRPDFHFNKPIRVQGEIYAGANYSDRVYHQGFKPTYEDVGAVSYATRTTWGGNTRAQTAVVGELMWKNYGNGHTIFDASNSTTPAGGPCSPANPQNNWSASYPTLMGFNGGSTFGVRVDSARSADTATLAPSYLPLNGGNMAGTIGRSTHNSGYLVGSYNSVGGNDSKTNPIYTIGGNYTPGSDTLGNMYGIGYSTNNFWGSGKSSGWGMYVCSDGVINATISDSGIWTAGRMVAHSYVGHGNVAGTGSAIHCPSGIFSEGTNWLYGQIITANNTIQTGTAWVYSGGLRTTGDVEIGGNLSVAYRMGAKGSGNDFASGAVELLGNGAANTVFPTIGFHQPSLYAGSLQQRSGSEFGFYRQGGTALANLNLDTLNTTGNIYAQGSVHANGGLVQDGQTILNGTDTWLRTYGSAGWHSESYGGGIHMTDDTWVRVYNNRKFYVSNYDYDAINIAGGLQVSAGGMATIGRGVTGYYNASRFQGVFAMGPSYQLPADGTSGGSLYGIAWTHSNTVSMHAQRIGGHQMVLMENGTTMSALGRDGWFAGSLTIGGTSTSSSLYMTDIDATSRVLHCNSDRIGFLTAAGGWGSFCGNGGDWHSISTITGTDCISTSDRRVKENITPITDAIGKLAGISGNTFNRLDMEGRLHAGVIAQEVQAVLPEAIFETVDGELGSKLNVSSSAMLGLLVQVCKEQQELIAALRRDVDMLKGGK